jgi:hypothetical protein
MAGVAMGDPAGDYHPRPDKSNAAPAWAWPRDGLCHQLLLRVDQLQTTEQVEDAQHEETRAR